MNDFALGLGLERKLRATRKQAIVSVKNCLEGLSRIKKFEILTPFFFDGVKGVVLGTKQSQLGCSERYKQLVISTAKRKLLVISWNKIPINKIFCPLKNYLGKSYISFPA